MVLLTPYHRQSFRYMTVKDGFAYHRHRRCEILHTCVNGVVLICASRFNLCPECIIDLIATPIHLTPPTVSSVAKINKKLLSVVAVPEFDGSSQFMGIML